MRVLETGPGPSGRALRVLHCRAISPTPQFQKYIFVHALGISYMHIVYFEHIHTPPSPARSSPGPSSLSSALLVLITRCVPVRIAHRLMGVGPAIHCSLVYPPGLHPERKLTRSPLEAMSSSRVFSEGHPLPPSPQAGLWTGFALCSTCWWRPLAVPGS